MKTPEATRARRAYDNTLRRERAAQTHERIISAGADVLRGTSIRDWRGLTIRAVAERAGVAERTVYRHFSSERALHDAVLHHLEQEAGVDLEHMHLDGIAEVTTRIFASLPRYRLEARSLDPTLADAKRRLHDALLAAVTEEAPRWSVADRTLAAAAFDVLWAVAAYERLVLEWQLDPEEATRASTWMIDLVADAVREGRRPPRPPHSRP